MSRDTFFLHMAHQVERNALHLAGGGRQALNRCIDGDFWVILRVDVERIEGLLLTRDEDFFRAVHDEISAIVIRAFSHFLKELFRLSVENTVATVKHDGDATEGPLGKRVRWGREIVGDRLTAFFHIIGNLYQNRRIYRGRIGEISQTSLIGVENTNLFRVLKTDRRSSHFNGSSILSADEDLYTVFVGVRFFIQ